MNEHDEIHGLRLTLCLYVIIFAMKLGVYFLSGVMALMAEALHTLSDIFISGFLLIAAVYSRRVADRRHMFGYGRAQNIAALVAATLFISFTSFELYREAIPHLFSEESARHQNVELAIGVLILSMLIALWPLVSLLRQRERGAALKAQYLELINDELGLLAALVGTLFVLWGFPIADPIASIVVATIIAVNAVGLFRENMSFLLGQAPDPEMLAKVETALRVVPGVLGVHELKAEYVGAKTVHAVVHVQVAGTLTVEEGHQIARQVDQVLEGFMGIGLSDVHVDPRPSGARSEPPANEHRPDPDAGQKSEVGQ